MPNWIVRKNCEYSILIEADNAEEAIDKIASMDDLSKDWAQAWSDWEAEEE